MLRHGRAAAGAAALTGPSMRSINHGTVTAVLSTASSADNIGDNLSGDSSGILYVRPAGQRVTALCAGAASTRHAHGLRTSQVFYTFSAMTVSASMVQVRHGP